MEHAGDYYGADAVDSADVLVFSNNHPSISGSPCCTSSSRILLRTRNGSIQEVSGSCHSKVLPAFFQKIRRHLRYVSPRCLFRQVLGHPIEWPLFSIHIMILIHVPVRYHAFRHFHVSFFPCGQCELSYYSRVCSPLFCDMLMHARPYSTPRFLISLKQIV